MKSETQLEQTEQEKPRELIRELVKKRERTVELAKNILRNGYVEFSLEEGSNHNANKDGYKEDPGYRKLRCILSMDQGPPWNAITGNSELDHGVALKCGDLAEKIMHRTLDERTYTFLLENSPETIAKHLFYNDWSI